MCLRVYGSLPNSIQRERGKEIGGCFFFFVVVVLDMFFSVAVALFSSLLVKYLRLSLSSKDVSLM